jgi:hypothetical protein
MLFGVTRMRSVNFRIRLETANAAALEGDANQKLAFRDSWG